jgi:clan AA aspartic protease (TIGR02281 family)
MKLIIFRILIAVALVSNSLCSYSQTTIKMQKENGVYIVPCKVNELNLKFIFDTGASDVSISLTEALFMVKNGYLNKDDILGQQYFRDATGEISEGTKIILRKIEFGGCVIYNVEASVVNQISAPLLLGQSAMAKLGKFQFDPASGMLVIFNGKKITNQTINSNPSPNIPIEKENAIPPIDFFQSTNTCNFDFGTISKGQDGNRFVPFTNNGQIDFKIIGIETSCSCIKATFPGNEIVRGKFFVIPFTYDTGRIGEFQKTITLTTNVEGYEQRTIIVKGNVTP